MKQKHIKEVWRSLNVDDKRKLARLAFSTYESMFVLVGRAHIGVKMQEHIYRALIDMSLVDARLKPETAKQQLFGGVKSTKGQAA